MRALVIALVLAQALPAAAKSKAKPPAKPAKPAAPQPPSPPPPLCSGDYADALPAEKAASILDAVKQPFVFAIRNTATYEHVYYGRDGKLRRAYLRSVVHGTAFAYRVGNGETQLVTNEHVASQPDVTDDEHGVEGVPTGSKKVREQLKIVRDETDDYEPGHVPLAKVLSDTQADIAVLKTRKQLPVMPYRLRRSATLRAGDPGVRVPLPHRRAGIGGHLPRRIYRCRGVERGGGDRSAPRRAGYSQGPEARLLGAARGDHRPGPRQAGQAALRRAHPQRDVPVRRPVGGGGARRPAADAILDPGRRLSAHDAGVDGARRPGAKRIRHARFGGGVGRRSAGGSTRAGAGG